MNGLLSIGLPLSLAFIMFSLGLGLTGADFARVLKAPRAVLTGAAAQVLVLPITAFAILAVAPLDPALSVGVMILAFCPGGVTTNMLTRLAGGDLALSITLTAVVSLVSVLTVPPLVALSAAHFMGADAPDIAVGPLALTMFAITTVPVLAGMAMRRFAPGVTARIDRPAFILAAILFALILAAALAANWGLFVDNLSTLGPILIGMNVALLFLGAGMARLAGLPRDQRAAIAIEAGVQNGTVGITVGSIVAGAADAASGFVLPSAVYGVTMYLVTLPAVFLVFRPSLARSADVSPR